MDEIKSNNYYDQYWKDRDNEEYFAGYYPAMKKFLINEIQPLGNKLDILEAGCGAAAFTPILKEYSSTILATDISKEQIEINQKNHKDIEFMVIDLSEKFPFQDNTFDLIWCSEVLEHLYFPLFALGEFKRVLRPGGKLLVTVPYHGILKNMFIALFRFDKHYDPEYPHVRFFTKQTLSRIVYKAGLSNIELKTCGMNIPLRDLIIPTNILLKAEKL